MKRILILLLVGFLGSTSLYAASNKYLIILQAGEESHESMARAYHALLYSQELLDHGHEVVLVFDGAGTHWANVWSNLETEGKFRKLYLELRKSGVTEVICDYCATAFKERVHLDARQANFKGDYKGHPSIAKYANDGYQILIL